MSLPVSWGVLVLSSSCSTSWPASSVIWLLGGKLKTLFFACKITTSQPLGLSKSSELIYTEVANDRGWGVGRKGEQE